MHSLSCPYSSKMMGNNVEWKKAVQKTTFAASKISYFFGHINLDRRMFFSSCLIWVSGGGAPIHKMWSKTFMPIKLPCVLLIETWNNPNPINRWCVYLIGTDGHHVTVDHQRTHRMWFDSLFLLACGPEKASPYSSNQRIAIVLITIVSRASTHQRYLWFVTILWNCLIAFPLRETKIGRYIYARLDAISFCFCKLE